ncbi:MAG: glycogen synthase GlgA [Verrucomicrobiales bacterium]|nr:glycogen synthase GlgA [Verrucomicrobiales bacterium]
MRVLLASSELNPFSKTGGLADMVAALAKNLAAAGHTVGVVTPLYRSIWARHQPRRMDWQMTLPLGARSVSPEIWTLEPHPGLTVYFVHAPEFFDRDGIYGDDKAAYPDNAERFVAFSKAVVHLARYLPWQPEVLHVHDWQAGLVPLLVRHARTVEGWATAPRTVLTIHNLAYQGVFPAAAYALSGLPPDYFHLAGAEFHGSLNLLKSGIVYADAITTVSPRYAREITTREFGEGLDGVIRDRRTVLSGILNGVDYDEWRTEGNPFLPFSYSADHPEGKARIKAALQEEVGLPVRGDVPLFGTVGRLADQKGVDIALGALEEMLSTRIQFVSLGSGQPELQAALGTLATRHPDRVASRVKFDVALSHRIEAACDFFLMPSRFEPCGLNQMYSLRYGTIPIVRRTGGLDDSVVDYRDHPDRANGIKFELYSSRALAKAMRKALALYGNAEWMSFYRQNGMRTDFSWDRTRRDYEALYVGAS